MDRKEFLRNSLLVTGAILLPNAIWAFDKNFNAENRSLNKFVSKPNLKRFKVSELGTKFFETELSIIKSKTDFKLHRKFFISENINGICTPTLLETSRKESLVFIPELYQDKKHNGFIVKVCENGICEETKIFTHENQGYYAFWGKEYLGNPTLYHYNAETFHLMRMQQENGHWINHRVMPIYPDEMVALYKQQVQQVEQGQLTQQFGYDFEIHKDGFYQFLSLKNDWEQSIITQEKENYEKEKPAKIYTTANELTAKLNSETEFSYTNPFVPIWCEGDDYSHAITKPTIFYKEVAGTKIEIPNMPAYETQDDLGECRAFSVRTIMQKYTCEKWKSDIPDCANPPADLSISPFGMLIYTNNNFYEEEAFQPLQEKTRSMHDILMDISKNPSFILSSCKPPSNLVNNFSLKGKEGLENRDNFFDYLKKIYKDKNSIDLNIGDCLNEIEQVTGIKKELINLKKAFIQDSFDKFLYTLFFDGCKLEGFADGFRPNSYPNDKTNATTADIKNRIIEGLKKGKPVLLPSLCMVADSSNKCKEGHSVVVSGYKKVYKNKNELKNLFKVHNSWGINWQKSNNNGWVDADVLVNSTMREPTQSNASRIISGAVTWLEP